MDSTIKSLQMVRAALLGSVLVYAAIGEFVPHGNEQPLKVLFFAFSGIAITMVLITFVVRRMFIAAAESGMAGPTPDPAILHRWRGGYMVSFAFSEAVALLGFALRLLGFTLSQVAPFYVVGFFLLVFFGPRRPPREFPAATS